MVVAAVSRCVACCPAPVAPARGSLAAFREQRSALPWHTACEEALARAEKLVTLWKYSKASVKLHQGPLTVPSAIANCRHRGGVRAVRCTQLPEPRKIRERLHVEDSEVVCMPTVARSSKVLWQKGR